MFSTEDIYEVIIFSIGDTKSGTKMGKLQLKNTIDDTILNCILWEETLNRLDAKLFRTGNKLRILSATFNEKFNNCLVSSLELIEEAKLGLDEAEQDLYFNKILTFIEKITDEKMKIFLLNYLKEHEKEFKIAPAAKIMHHNYIGGLMVHTLECLELAEANAQLLYQQTNKNNLYMACLLHDIGKIFEYTVDMETGLIDYSETFRKEWISHSQYGFTLCMSNGFKIPAKMIAAHHGRVEWGAMIDLNERDLENYVYLVHHIDDLSAKFGKINISMLK